jgi:hypothetical protein
MSYYCWENKYLCKEGNDFHEQSIDLRDSETIFGNITAKNFDIHKKKHRPLSVPTPWYSRYLKNIFN